VRDKLSVIETIFLPRKSEPKFNKTAYAPVPLTVPNFIVLGQVKRCTRKALQYKKFFSILTSCRVIPWPKSIKLAALMYSTRRSINVPMSRHILTTRLRDLLLTSVDFVDGVTDKNTQKQSYVADTGQSSPNSGNKCQLARPLTLALGQTM